MSTENLKIGARGWQHSRWEGVYYPDDLPRDWQLTYYANDFDIVLVPQAYWQASTGYDVEEWLEAVGENFRFYIEYPSFTDDVDMQRFQKQCVELGNQLGGILMSGKDSVDALVVSCPVLYPPLLQSDSLCVGVLDKAFGELRKTRNWLEAFDHSCDVPKKMVFVSNGNENDIEMAILKNIQTLAEMMGL